MALKPVGAADVGIACIFNGFFWGASVIDLGADTFALRDWAARGQFLRTYYEFRHDNPIIGPVLGVLLLLLPFVLYAMFTEDVLGLWRRPRHRGRHVWGSIGLFGIFAIVTFTLAVVRPAEDALLGLTAVALTATGAGAASRLWALHAGVAAFNGVMVVQPFFKHAADAAAPPVPAEAVPGPAPSNPAARPAPKAE